MAQRHYNINLAESAVALTSKDIGTTTMSRSSDTGTDKPESVPRIMYLQNVMPTESGYASVGLGSKIAAISGEVNITRGFWIRGDEGSSILICYSYVGDFYSFTLGVDTAWQSITYDAVIASGIVSGREITVATVNGLTYMYVESTGCYTFDESAGEFSSVTLTGITTVTTLGIVASSGYLVVYSEYANAWSSTIDPTDFTPSTVTGAGGGNVAGLRSPILVVAPSSEGFILYTTINAIAATYTGNKQYPFKYKEIPAANGCRAFKHVTYESTSNEQFVYTRSGMQSVTSRGATSILAEVTNFITAGILESYDAGTKSIVETRGAMVAGVNLVANRYLVISYGITNFDYAIIYDIAMKRLGKVKVTHVLAFTYLIDDEASQQFIGFMAVTGEVIAVNAPNTTVTGTDDAVLMLGKLQYSEGRTMTLQNVEVARVDTNLTLSVWIQTYLNGMDISAVKETTLEDATSTLTRSYTVRAFGKSVAVLLLGSFNLTSVSVDYSVHGKR